MDNPLYQIYILIDEDYYQLEYDITEEQMLEHMLHISPFKVISQIIKERDADAFDDYNYCSNDDIPIIVTVQRETFTLNEVSGEHDQKIEDICNFTLIPANLVKKFVKLVQDKMKQEAYIREKQAINNKYDKGVKPINEKYWIDVQALKDKREKDSKPFVDTYNESTKVFRNILRDHLNPIDHKLWESIPYLDGILWKSIKPFRDKRDKALDDLERKNKKELEKEDT